MKKTTLFVVTSVFLFVFAGCIEKIEPEGGGTGTENPGEIFDFSTTTAYTLSVKYDVPEGYQVYFEVYEENPIQINTKSGQYEKKGIKPVEKGFTDKNGNYNQKITIPSAIENFYVYSSYIGVPAVLKAGVNGKSISATVADEVILDTDTKAVTRANADYLTIHNDFINALGDWDKIGRPEYLAGDKIELNAALLTKINNAFNEGRPVNEKFFKSTDIHITGDEKAEIKLCFIHENSSNRNVLGYFCYETGKAPKSAKEIDKIVAFPNAKLKGKGKPYGNLEIGEYIQLHYWKDKTDMGTKFPPKTSIGWVLCSNGYDYNGSSGISNGNGAVFYSLPELNTTEPEGKRNHVALFNAKDKDKSFVFFGFEDWHSYGDRDCNDVVFHVESNPADAITNEIPEVEEPDLDPTKISYVKYYEGTLAFEDLWPSKGDYDMNDVVVAYQAHVNFNRFNQALSCVDTFTMLHDGGAFQNGFGFQLKDVYAADVTATTSAPENYTPVGELGLDRFQSIATFILMESSKTMTKDMQFIDTIAFKKPIALEQAPVPPYNPFIVVKTVPGAPFHCYTEVHLPNYTPAGYQDKALLGTQDDRSKPEAGTYYVSNEQYPFAIHIPGNYKYVIPTEKTRISEFYSKFDSWASSKGEKDKDWYKHPRK